MLIKKTLLALLCSSTGIGYITAAEFNIHGSSTEASSSQQLAESKGKSKKKSSCHTNSRRPSRSSGKSSRSKGRINHDLTSEDFNNDPAGLRAAAWARAKIERTSMPNENIFFSSSDSMMSHELRTMLLAHKTQLLSPEEATVDLTDVMNRHSWGRQLNRIIKQFQYPDAFGNSTSPSRLLFTGPSGCGKTFSAKAIAAAAQMQCLFIKGTAVKDRYQNSGADFLTNLFRVLLQHPHLPFLVIIDELRPIIESDKESKNQTQQKDTTGAFWQGLDQCVEQKHICVVCTDNMKPDDLEDTIQTRFAGQIFEFSPVDTPSIARIIKKCLTPKAPLHDPTAPSCSTDIIPSQIPTLINNCSDAFILSKARSVSHFSIRAIVEFVEQAKAFAAEERLDAILAEKDSAKNLILKEQPVIVEEQHLNDIWNRHNPGWFSRLLKNSYFKACTSHKLVFSLAGATAFGISLYGIIKENQKCKKGGALALGAATSLYALTKDKSDESILGYFTALTGTLEHFERNEQLAESRMIEDDRYKQQRQDAQIYHSDSLLTQQFGLILQASDQATSQAFTLLSLNHNPSTIAVEAINHVLGRPTSTSIATAITEKRNSRYEMINRVFNEIQERPTEGASRGLTFE